MKRSDYNRHDFDHSPLVVFYETTRACDLVCLHCRACAQSLPDANELATADSRLLLEQLSQFPKPPMVVLTGGDPLKRADIYQLVEYGTELGLHMSITPSATPLVTQDALIRLKEAGIVRMALSLDGADSRTHDAFRGFPGSFGRTMQILATARSLGISLQVNTTITPANYRQIDEMVELVSDFEIALWSVFFLVPVGRGASISRLTASEYEGVFEKLHRHSLRSSIAIKTTEAPHYRRFSIQQNKLQTGKRKRPLARFTTLGVNDGKGVMFVSHAGTIHPSGFMPIVCGVFPHQHVVDVYQKSRLMQSLRDTNRLEGKCGFCDFRNICGGSRARAYAVTGNPFAEEPDCVYQPPLR